MRRGANAMGAADYSSDDYEFLETKYALEDSYWDIDYQIELADERYTAGVLAFADEVNSIPGQPFTVGVEWDQS